MVSFSISPNKKKKAARRRLAAFQNDDQPTVCAAACTTRQALEAGAAPASEGVLALQLPEAMELGDDEQGPRWLTFSERAVAHACRGEFKRSATMFASAVRHLGPLLPTSALAPSRTPSPKRRPRGSAGASPAAGEAAALADAPLDQNGEPRMPDQETNFTACQPIRAPPPPSEDQMDSTAGQVDPLKAAKIFEQYAQVLMELGQYSRASRVARRSVELAPQWAMAHQTLYRAQLNEGNPHAAAVSAESALMHATNDAMMEEMRRERSEINDICTQFDTSTLELEQKRAKEQNVEALRLARAEADADEQEQADIRSGLKDVFSATRMSNGNGGRPSGTNTCGWASLDTPTFEDMQAVAKNQREKHEKSKNDAAK